MNQNSRLGGMVAGIILIALGVLLLLAKLVNIPFGHYFWPFFVIGAGALFFVGAAMGGRSVSGLVIPGSIITTIGLILLVQNTFDLWDSWSYAWSLILVAVGVGLLIQARIRGSQEERRAGWNLVRLGLILFLVFGAFFEALIGINGKTGGMVWAAALIVAGVYLVFRQMGWFGAKSSAAPQAVSQEVPPQPDPIQAPPEEKAEG